MISAMTLGARAQEQETPRFRIVVNGGYSYRVGKLPSGFSGETRDYMKKLKSGFNIGADVQYYFNDSWGIGLKYLRFQSSGSAVIPVETPTDYGRAATSDNIGISFYGPTFLGRVYTTNDNSQAFIIGASLGYMRYKDNGKVATYPVVITGGTVGSGVDVGYDIRIARKLYAGAQLSYFAGSLSKYTIEQGNQTTTRDLKDDERENLSHLSISAGLRFHL
ncbi:Outer membrane protein beta-barrel domain-containing protein [Chitinophaga eiseniae]|uniref:Outer membrane protein beta-barrel domain-containing protein n=2 Tax=Chitinophaga eiseniae TaxID=634771 RepID=A0A1T4TUB2_9BACT|nr:Outer membrane protein beta-barrel domain-containing protein [Chitinophaga eiseniae]